MFISSMILTLSGFWVDAWFLVTLYENAGMQLGGSLLVLFGFVNLKTAFRHLGRNYSPSFDAYLPSELVTSGPYRFIRHPVYLFNLCVSFGLAIASGSLLVMFNALVGLLFVLKIIAIEEASLRQHFPGYAVYTQNSWRLIPFCF